MLRRKPTVGAATDIRSEYTTNGENVDKVIIVRRRNKQ
jgi:hypothetical protein